MSVCSRSWRTVAMYLLVLLVCAWAVCAEQVVVTSSGPVRGKLLHDNGVSYYAYQGIPYAENPTGPLRFQPPVPKKPWSVILDATKTGPACPQPALAVPRDAMSEDCLRINVFVPANRTQRLLPVLVYVHGGAFKANTGNVDTRYGPQLLLKRGIIMVSMNYRLGALGFLSLETKEASGNAGLKDLLLALQWIKNNIHQFGGNTITLGGHSSGAAMVHHMMLSERTTGLFDRAILTSGSATNFRFLSRYPREHAHALAKELGFTDGEDDIIVQKLRKANVFDIINAQENLYKSSRNPMSPFGPFVPCIEKKTQHSILTRDPIEIIEEGLPQNVPILTGINSLEGGFMWPALHNKSSIFLQKQFPLSFPDDIEIPTDSDIYYDLVNSVKELYFGDINLSNFTLHNFYDLLSDTQFTYSVGSWVKLHKERKGSNKLYYYLLNFDGDLNWAKINYKIRIPGAVHADEIGYLFINSVTNDKLKNLDWRSQRTLDIMLTLISSFIKVGKPGRAEHLCCAQWPEYGSTGRHLLINERPSLATHAPFAKRFAFWSNIYKQYNQYVLDGCIREHKMTHHCLH